MTSLFPYLLEASLILLLLFTFFLLFLRHRASPLLNRFYLLSALMFSMVVPLISIPVNTAGNGNSSFLLQPASKAWNLLPELIIRGGADQPAVAEGTIEMNWQQYALYLYFAGIFISLLLTAGRIRKIYQLIRQYPFRYSPEKEYKIAPTSGKLPTFSFLHYIFWDNTAPLNETEARLVLQHERAHVRQHHSIDNIFLEFIKALLWFNPLIYIYRYSLRQVHEHLADRYALGQAEPESYFSLLVKQTLRQANIPLASQFFQHNTLNRIRMLQTKSNRNILRATLGALIFGLIFFVAACQDESLPETKDQITSAAAEVEEKESSHLLMLDIEYPENQKENNSNNMALISEGSEIIYVFGNAKYTISDFKNEEIRKKVENALTNTPREELGENGGKIPHIVLKIADHKIKPGPNLEKMNAKLNKGNKPSPVSEKGHRLFEVVEESPKPVGGMDAFYRQLAETLVYPEQAISKGVEGRVYVQFVVEPDGSVTEVKTVKGLGAGCDEAAVEAIKKTMWNPGKQRDQEVAVRMVIPVMFKL